MTQKEEWHARGALNSWPFKCAVNLLGARYASGNYRTECSDNKPLHIQNIIKLHFLTQNHRSSP